MHGHVKNELFIDAGFWTRQPIEIRLLYFYFRLFDEKWIQLRRRISFLLLYLLRKGIYFYCMTIDWLKDGNRLTRPHYLAAEWVCLLVDVRRIAGRSGFELCLVYGSYCSDNTIGAVNNGNESITVQDLFFSFEIWNKSEFFSEISVKSLTTDTSINNKLINY